MITQSQLRDITRLSKIDETVVLREYFQVWFLRQLYEQKKSELLFFKEGTAIRLLFGGTRFSEDLDFTSLADVETTKEIVEKAAQEAEKEAKITLDTVKSLAGLRYRLTYRTSILPQPVYIRIDVSLREPILQPEKSVITTPYPILFTQFIHHPSRAEIVAEKIRALSTRFKGRDLYDLWFLFQLNTPLDTNLIEAKLAHYQLTFDPQAIVDRLNMFPKKEFITDLQPFVPLNEREKLPEFYDFSVAAIQKYVKSNSADTF